MIDFKIIYYNFMKNYELVYTKDIPLKQITWQIVIDTLQTLQSNGEMRATPLSFSKGIHHSRFIRYMDFMTLYGWVECKNDDHKKFVNITELGRELLANSKKTN